VGGPFNAYSVLQGVDRIVTGRRVRCRMPSAAGRTLFCAAEAAGQIDQMTLAKRPTEVRLQPQMVEEFKKGVMVAQTPERNKKQMRQRK